MNFKLTTERKQGIILPKLEAVHFTRIVVLRDVPAKSGGQTYRTWWTNLLHHKNLTAWKLNLLFAFVRRASEEESALLLNLVVHLMNNCLSSLFSHLTVPQLWGNPTSSKEFSVRQAWALTRGLEGPELKICD